MPHLSAYFESQTLCSYSNQFSAFTADAAVQVPIEHRPPRRQGNQSSRGRSDESVCAAVITMRYAESPLALPKKIDVELAQ